MSRRILSAVLIGLLAIGAASCAGEDQVGTLVADNARIAKETSTGAMHAACGTMEDDADTANDELPTPDPEVTDWLSTAYGLEGTAATDCYDAGVTNKKLLATAERDTMKAAALYSRALIRIQSIDGRVPSPTTTTDNGPISIFG